MTMTTTTADMIAVTIRVTPEDIAQGKPGKCRNCPVYRAASRVLNRVDLVTRGGIYLVSAFSFRQVKVELPAPARIFMYAFDELRPVSPIDFTVLVPREYVRAEVQR